MGVWELAAVGAGSLAETHCIQGGWGATVGAGGLAETHCI